MFFSNDKFLGGIKLFLFYFKLPEMKCLFVENRAHKKFLQIFLILLFTLIGWAIMVLLAIFEDDIEFDFGISC